MNPMLSSFEEKSTRLNKEYAEFLRGKSVCVVGRGGLENMEQGEFIDSHDVVVRMHELWPWEKAEHPGNTSDGFREKSMVVPERWRSRIGSKCHVLFIKIELAWVRYAEEKLSFWKREVEAFRVNGGRFLCGESWFNHSRFDAALYSEHFDIRYLTIDHWLNTLRELMRIAGEYICPYSGTLVAADILRYDVERVYITGMPNNLPDRSPIENRANLGFLVSLADRFPERVSIDKNMREVWKG